MKKIIISIIVTMAVLFSGVYADSAYDNLAPEEQGLHIWIFVIMLSMIAILTIINYHYDVPEFGMFAGIIMVIVAGTIFNGITFEVCNVNVDTSTSYCETQLLDVPFWFKTAIEIIFLAMGGLMLVLNVVRIYNHFKENKEATYMGQ